jgi:cytochrome c oxidase subunit 2
MNNKTTSITVVVLFLLTLVWIGWIWAHFGWMPEAKSNLAPIIDAPFYFVLWTSAIATVGVVLAMLWLVVQGLGKDGDKEPEPVAANTGMEVAWIVMMTVLVMFVFAWGFRAFMIVTQPPANAYEIRAFARKWAWEFEYPNGLRTTNELFLPSNRPVKMLMSSSDVLHSFWVPEFRVKQDVIPNRYSTVWFEATVETPAPEGVGDTETAGYLRLLCTEYCGTGHSAMMAKVWVLPQDGFDEFLASGGGGTEDMPLEELGAALYTQKACNGCHSTDGSPGVGPTLQGILGAQETMTDGSTVTVDENYLRESIVVPAAKVVEGYQPIMPPIPMSDREVDALVEFIKGL